MKSLELPKFLKVKLNLHLNKNITIYNNLKLKKNLDFWTERDLFKKIESKDKFEKFIYNTLPEVFPKSYLENFKLIENNLNLLNWPEKPKIIFTSYDHYFNDAFKIYTMKGLLVVQNFLYFNMVIKDIMIYVGLLKKFAIDILYWEINLKIKKFYLYFVVPILGKLLKKNQKNNVILYNFIKP